MPARVPALALPVDACSAADLLGYTNREPTLAALRWGWGEAYQIGWDATRGWWAARRDGRGGDITVGDPDQLWKAILDDYTLLPVPRDCQLPVHEESQ